MTHSHRRERVFKGPVVSEHLLQLFDDGESLAEGVADFLYEGWSHGQTLLVVARPQAWTATAERLGALGCNVSEAAASGRLVSLDAAMTLASFSRNGLPRADLFEQHVGSLVRRLNAGNAAGVRIYGEMVDLLATRGDFSAAEQLETMWNDLGTESPFTLLCGYASANFADDRAASALHAICCTHTKTTVKPADLLGAWLLSGRQPRASARFV
jgi:hypothetical protein